MKVVLIWSSPTAVPHDGMQTAQIGAETASLILIATSRATEFCQRTLSYLDVFLSMSVAQTEAVSSSIAPLFAPVKKGNYLACDQPFVGE